MGCDILDMIVERVPFLQAAGRGIEFVSCICLGSGCGNIVGYHVFNH